MDPPAVTPEPRKDPAAPPASPAVDVEALAERVYRLMLEEARLERARSGESPRRGS